MSAETQITIAHTTDSSRCARHTYTHRHTHACMPNCCAGERVNFSQQHIHTHNKNNNTSCTHCGKQPSAANRRAHARELSNPTSANEAAAAKHHEQRLLVAGAPRPRHALPGWRRGTAAPQHLHGRRAVLLMEQDHRRTVAVRWCLQSRVLARRVRGSGMAHV